MVVRLVNQAFDRLVRPSIHLNGCSLISFHFCGLVGLFLAVTLGFGLLYRLNLSLWVGLSLLLAAVVTVLLVAMGTKILTGREKLIYYHHEIAILFVSAIGLALLNQPVLVYLDVVVLSLGLFLACGRIGCLMMGCCHGRPHYYGVCYHADHAATGFPHSYVGVRLFPIQLVESAYVLLVVLTGIGWLLSGQAAGTALVWYIIWYDIGRFLIEFGRGDAERPYFLGFSEPQWLSLGLMFVIVFAELSGWLVLHWWHIVMTLNLMLITAGIGLYRKRFPNPLRQLLHPRHFREMVDIFYLLQRYKERPLAVNSVDVPVWVTSLGLQISVGNMQGNTQMKHAFTLSRQPEPLEWETAVDLVTAIQGLTSPAASFELRENVRGIYHVLDKFERL